MSVILPGQEFELSYGEGQTVRVKSLSGQQQLELAEIMQRAIDAESEGSIVALIQAAKDAMIYIFGDAEGERLFRESVNAPMAMEIARKMYAAGQLSEDDEKN